MRFPAALTAFCIVVLAGGCSDYTHTTRRARDEYYAGKYTDAAKSLEKGASEEGVDQLLYIFDRATALHNASDYDAAIKEFRRADRIADISDYTSLSKEAATLITNDRITHYKGEDFEKVLINQYLAIDYLMKGELEDAQVESRRVNRKLYLMITEGKRKYQLNPMAKYVSALIYEMHGQFNDAYIDYKGVYDLTPGMPYLRRDLYRSAAKAGLRDASEKWRAQYGLTDDEAKAIRAEAGKPEVVVIVELGKSPEKVPHPNWQAIPKYVPRANPIDYVDVQVEAIAAGAGPAPVGAKASVPEAAPPVAAAGRSYELFDVEAAAIKNLDEKWGGLLAKRIGGVVAKEIIAGQVDRRVDPLLGMILRIGMHAADQADLRAWLTLPKNFQIYRARVEGGRSYKLTITPHGGGAPFEKIVTVPEGPHAKAFVPVRVL